MALVQECHSDFVLFPREQPYLEMLESRQDDAFENIVHYTTASDMNHHFSDLASTTYDAYPSNSSFSAAASNYYGGSGAASNFAIDAPKENDRLNQRQFTPSGSPSPSMSQSFDHPPSILSSTSGASAQSTASSAAGSPYSHETNHIPSQEHWTESHQGLGIAPAIVHHEGFGSDLYPLTNISSNDIIFGEDKFSNNFVGKSRNIFSSSISPSSAASPVPASVSFCTSSQSFSTAFSSSPLALDTTMTTRDVTIDTILEEVNNRIATPSTDLTSPASARSMEASPRYFRSKCLAPQSSPRVQSAFKSPTTPASATSPFTSRSTPPPSVRPHESRRNSLALCSELKAQQSPTTLSHRAHPYAYCRPTPPSTAQTHFHTHQFQSPFVGQSSGRFIAPLESSCWFSLISRSQFSVRLFCRLILKFSPWKAAQSFSRERNGS